MSTSTEVNDSSPDFIPKRLSILVPVYNERYLLKSCIEKIRAAPLPPGISREIILVDDASTDGTRVLVEELGREDRDEIRGYFHDI
ncbi:MAG: glycosyltransferase, partial [Planctomycetes bacterium]|nr:glycosyltransferase [Planctomycetota bacterium]